MKTTNVKSNRNGRGFLMAMLAVFTGFFKPGATTGSGIRGTTSNGRDAFYGVSAPRCHTQKPKWQRARARAGR